MACWTPVGRAGFVVSAPTDLQVLPGGGGSFDVTIADTDADGSLARLISGFQFELRVVSTSGITFTDASSSTANPYVFAGNGANDVFGIPFVSSDSTPTDMILSDTVAQFGTFATIGPGQTLALAHITFASSLKGPSGSFAIQIVPFDLNTEPEGTLLSDPNGAAIPSTIFNGLITVGPSAVPEPSSLLLCLGGLGLVAARRAIERRRDRGGR